MIKVGVLGSEGRMGKQIQSLLQTDFSKTAVCFAKVDRDGNFDSLLNCELVIDFSLPEGAVQFVQASLDRKKKGDSRNLPTLIVGSTGWKLEQRRILEEYAVFAPVLHSSNFSLGVLAFFEVVRQASVIFDKLKFSPRIVETHHIHKKDAPSGTAVSLQRLISPLGPGNVPTQSLREGEVVGTHDVFFEGEGAEIQLTHRAEDRTIFARGAISIGVWAAQKRASDSKFMGLHTPEIYFKALMTP